MAITVANTDLTNTFDYWRTRTNELAAALSANVVTTGGTPAAGNAEVNGYFYSNVLSTNGLRGGNNTVLAVLPIITNVSVASSTVLIGNSISNVVISVSGGLAVTNLNSSFGNSSSNVVVSQTGIVISSGPGSLAVGNSSSNVVVSQTGITINGAGVVGTGALINVATIGTSAQIIDNFLFASFRGAEYTIVVRDTNANNVQMSKALVCTDNGDGYITEFGTNISNTDLGIMSANANATHVRVYFTPTVANTLVKGQRMIVVV